MEDRNVFIADKQVSCAGPEVAQSARMRKCSFSVNENQSAAASASNDNNILGDEKAINSKANDCNDLKNIKNDLNEDSTSHRKSITVTSTADLIGEFGYFQFSLSLLALIRYISAAMMTNSGSLLAPELEFRCDDLSMINNNPLIGRDDLIGKCHDVSMNNLTFKFNCSQWAYKINGEFQHNQQTTLTDSFNLICERDWLRSAFQSSVSIGVVLASVIWGSFSDRHGRHLTIRVCFILSLLSGSISYLAQDYFVFALARAFCSFGDIGLAVTLITIIVETLGNKYRGPICIIAYTGWAFGVMIVPWLIELMYLKTFILFTLICHILTLPWILFTVRESIRWLMVNGKFREAKREVLRILTWNQKFQFAIYGNKLNSDKTSLNELDFKFNLLMEKFPLLINEKEKLDYDNNSSTKDRKFGLELRSIFSSVSGSFSKIGQLIKSKELLIVSLTMIWITFNCELFYMTTILINSDIGNSVKLNYAIGGLMETLASIIAIYLINKVTRKLSIIGILSTISTFCLILALTHERPAISIYVLNLTKLAVSTLSSVIYVATTELFPTNLRQTGFGLTATLGGLGSVVSPFVRTELVQLIGLTWVLLILAALPMSAVLIIPFFLKETKGVELSDNIDGMKNVCKANSQDLEGNQRRSFKKEDQEKELITLPPAPID